LETSARIWTRSLASRFDSGSSIRNACGWRTIARPIATRWRWPARQLARLRSRFSVSSRILAALLDALVDLGLGHLLQLEREGDVVAHGEVRVQGVRLEHHGDVAILGLEVVHDLAADAQLARRDRLEPGDHPQRGRLARSPDGPTSTKNSPSATSSDSLCTA
jgi:hypothetical protein